jgi:hypothetical protein
MSCERTAQLFWPDHDPDAQLDYDLDLTDAMPAADTVALAVVSILPVTVPALTEVSTTIDPAGKIVTVWLSGGLAGTYYEVVVTATTSSTPQRVFDQTVNIKVREK